MQVTRKQMAYDHIRRKLTAGSLHDGARLSPAAVAKEIGVSPIPVREAISQLQSEGLLVQKPRQGAFVRQPDRAKLVELIEVRAVLEVNAAGRAARRIESHELDELERHDDRLRTLAEQFARIAPGAKADFREPLSRWMLSDLAFHLVLLRAAGNNHVIKIIDDTRIMTHMFGFRTDPPSAWADAAAYFAENYRVHHDVTRAVRRRDTKAARRAMSAHMRLARKTLLARWDWAHSTQQSSNDLVAAEFPDSMRQQVQELQSRRLSGISDEG